MMTAPTTPHPGETPPSGAPRRSVRVVEAVAIVVGIVIGSGIFFMPSLVAANSPSGTAMLGLWLAGGLIGLAGALCYAELATTYPDAGGDYFFLGRAYGPEVGFLFGWARMTVIQTGAIAAAAFIAGNYISEFAPLGPASPALYAALLVVGTTALNLAGLRFGKSVQVLLAGAVAVGLVAVALAGFWPTTPPVPVAAPTETGAFSGAVGLAMIFILYTYGGWNEAAYLSAEIRAPQRNIAYALIIGVGVVTLVYLLINAAFLAGLGHAGMAESNAVAADLLRRSFGEPGAVVISVLVVVAVLGTVNASVITGGRSNYALGRDFPDLFGFMGRWATEKGVPAAALIVQAGITLLLIAGSTAFSWGRGGADGPAGGVKAMVAYTAPAFWFFFFLSGLAVLVLRSWDPSRPRPFRVPLYPFTPFLFCVVCLWMLCSAVAYAGVGSLVGAAVLLAGIPLIWLSGSRRQIETQKEP